MRLCRGQARETCPSRKYWMLALALSTAGGRLWQALQTALAHHTHTLWLGGQPWDYTMEVVSTESPVRLGSGGKPSQPSTMEAGIMLKHHKHHSGGKHGGGHHAHAP